MDVMQKAAEGDKQAMRLVEKEYGVGNGQDFAKNYMVDFGHVASDDAVQELFNYLKEIEGLESDMSGNLALLGVEGLTLGLGKGLVKKGMTKKQIDEIIEEEAYSIIDRMGEGVQGEGWVYKGMDQMFPKRDLTKKEELDLLKKGYVDTEKMSMHSARPDTAERLDKAVSYYTKQLEPFEKSLVEQAAKDTAQGYSQLSNMAIPMIPTAKNIYDAYNKRTDLLNKADQIRGVLSKEQLEQVEQMLVNSQTVYGKATPSLPAPSKEKQQELSTHKSTQEAPVTPTTFGENLTEKEKEEIEKFLRSRGL